MTFMRRIAGAIALDVATYEEVERERGANAQAMVVVLLSALSAGVGAVGLGAEGAVIPLITTFALMAWLAWALLTFEIGVRLLAGPETRSDVGELLRTLGFASAPGMLRVFGIIPALAVPAFVISAVWMLAAMILAIRQALDYRSTARAIAVCAIGWGLTVVLIALWGWGAPVLSASTQGRIP